MDAERLVRQHLARVRASFPDTPLVVLHIGTEQTAVARSDRMDVALLAMGSARTAREHFSHTPPAAAELENAIAAVEDEIMKTRALVPHDATLVASDAAIMQLARTAGLAGSRVPLDAVEQVFNRLAAVSLGRPAAQEDWALDREFCATVLILREFMHHTGSDAIVVYEPAA